MSYGKNGQHSEQQRREQRYARDHFWSWLIWDILSHYGVDWRLT